MTARESVHVPAPPNVMRPSLSSAVQHISAEFMRFSNPPSLLCSAGGFVYYYYCDHGVGIWLQAHINNHVHALASHELSLRAGCQHAPGREMIKCLCRSDVRRVEYFIDFPKMPAQDQHSHTRTFSRADTHLHIHPHPQTPPPTNTPTPPHIHTCLSARSSFALVLTRADRFLS